jgi:hypothetical protein
MPDAAVFGEAAVSRASRSRHASWSVALALADIRTIAVHSSTSNIGSGYRKGRLWKPGGRADTTVLPGPGSLTNC